jgi:hypothetical protein
MPSLTTTTTLTTLALATTAAALLGYAYWWDQQRVANPAFRKQLRRWCACVVCVCVWLVQGRPFKLMH